MNRVSLLFSLLDAADARVVAVAVRACGQEYAALVDAAAVHAAPDRAAAHGRE